ncbi:MAG: phosphoribosyltransferase [Gloeomargarita sp. SKYBB_i_bin120]|nr:phosphoribosyltransferase [Gloeomargarita sp. SKYG98]MCS7291795.1 phosphoribosyltransferase [Gloeomargarita sp. SKYB120]MDW8177355.1 phosphoribosyltransferase [Gloeomargarita sp. SKYBB_i_bin120]
MPLFLSAGLTIALVFLAQRLSLGRPTMKFPAFRNRVEAGRQLAHRLEHYARHSNGIVLALPRGGVPIGAEIARYLHLPLEVLVVRKLGVPRQPELAMGAIGGGEVVLWQALINALGITDEEIRAVIARERQEVDRREQRYRAGRPPLALHNRVVILTDDGVATGATMLVAVRVVRRHQPERIVVAAPVIALESLATLRQEADEVVYLVAPLELDGIGLWYEDFRQLTDEEVLKTLECLGDRDSPVEQG